MADASGLIFAGVLNGAGGCEKLDWDGIGQWSPENGVLWIHLDYKCEDSVRWLVDDSGLDQITCDAMLAGSPRPRTFVSNDGLMLILRGINLNEGAQPEDMVSIRAWVDEHRVITIRHRRVNALKTMQAKLIDGNGACSSAELLVQLVDETLARIVLVVDTLEDAVAENEDAAVAAGSVEIRSRLADLRRQAITLRRYIWPERDVVSGLRSEPVSWLSDVDRTRLRESADRLSRIIEELDAARDRAAVTAEEVASRLAEQINQRLYTLSIIAAVFLPLGFVTGLWGVNVGGIPGTQWEYGFALLCGAMVVLGVVQLWLFRKLRWL